MILSLFFGAFGFQKYYLGEIKQGSYSLLFCWIIIPSLIGVIDCIRIAFMSLEDFNIKYNKGKTSSIKHSKTYETTKIGKSKHKINVIKNETPPAEIEVKNTDERNETIDNSDKSIVDVLKESLNLSIEHAQELVIDKEKSPPYWEQTYVYSYDEMNYATQEQKEYYQYFKKKVELGEFVNIHGYTNYAFILYFDFLNEYHSHKDVKLLEEQFQLIGKICPKTTSYAQRSLISELSKRNDTYSIDKLKTFEESGYGYSDFLNILSILRQNPNANKRSLISDIEITDERPEESLIDGIEEL